MSFKQIISALRMGLAVAAALFSSILFRLENPYWAPTTIMVVEGINFGAFSKKIIPRLSGNLCGSISGVLLLAFLSQAELLFAAGLSLMIMICGYFMFEDRHPLFWRWTMVSACLICVSTINDPLHAFYLATDRMAGVGIGLFTNLIFHLFFFHRSEEKEYQNKGNDNGLTSPDSALQGNGYKAFLLGLSVFSGMVIWRETGWPGGAVIPLLALIQVMFCILTPSLTVPFLLLIQIISLIIASLISFFILPAIYSTEFFFIFVVLLYSFFGLLIHSSSPALGGIGLMTGILVNSCVYAYTPNFYAFSITTIYAWSMAGGALIAMLILTLFYPDRLTSNPCED